MSLEKGRYLVSAKGTLMDQGKLIDQSGKGMLIGEWKRHADWSVDKARWLVSGKGTLVSQR